MSFDFSGDHQLKINSKEIRSDMRVGEWGGHRTLSVTLGGKWPVPEITLRDAQFPNLPANLDRIAAGCASGVTVNENGFGKTGITSSYFFHKAGEAPPSADRFWIYFDRSMCGKGPSKTYEHDGIYAVCASNSSIVKCVRELSTPDYVATYVMGKPTLVDAVSEDELVRTYLSQAVQLIPR